MKRVLALPLGMVLVMAACGDPSAPADPPEPVSVAPPEGTAGTEVRIDGTAFQAGATVRFDDMESPAVQLEGGALFALAPAGLTVGSLYDVAVRNPGGGEAVLTDAFTAVAPTADRVNGVTKPTGLPGMTIIIEGASFGDDPAVADGHVYFETSTGAVLEASIADAVNDWTNDFVVTSVPQGVSDTSWLWVETATGATDTIEFRLIQSGTFSPSLINWTVTTPLPQPLQGLGAAFVRVEEGASPANYVFAVGGADTLNAATDIVYRATADPSAALGAEWADLMPLPEPRAYHATAAATGFTAALDTTTTAAYLYAIGGVDADDAVVSTVYVGHVDLAGDVTGWSATEPLPVALHSASAALFRGFIYVTGGADADDQPVSTTYRAAINEDGTLGAWDELQTLPSPTAYHSFVNFGPFLYVVGGETAATPVVQTSTSGTEMAGVSLARINLRTGDLTDAGWTATAAMAKGRSKHSTVFAGGALLATSGVYAGQPGSSENTSGDLQSDGAVDSWTGATGSETIDVELGYSLYNQAAVTFIDHDGTGHVLVLGGAKRETEGEPSSAVVYY
jgi:hypothetical protein